MAMVVLVVVGDLCKVAMRMGRGKVVIVALQRFCGCRGLFVA